jgi:L-ribulose-5-phosphate 3-epimerase
VNCSHRIGFMQGRLSPIVDGRIQAFPWASWKNEFPIAEEIGIHKIEWTLDQERLYENPLLTKVGQRQIKELCQRHSFTIPSLTGDCFMQAPLWKVKGEERAALESDFHAVLEGCVAVGIVMIVVPLVDNGRLENAEQEETLITFLESQTEYLISNGMKVVFESDFTPCELSRFIGLLNPTLFGINYDIGNSAALGFEPAEEIVSYGTRIMNVHIKDRLLGGTTVPLGTGNADFKSVFALLAKAGYDGNYVLQTARATDGDHAGVLSRYRDMTLDWLKCNAA